MRKRNLLASLGLALSPLACTHPCSQCGWSFQVGKPPVITTPIVLNPGATQYGASALTSGPVAGPLGPVPPMAPMPYPAPQLLPPAGPCIPTSYSAPAPCVPAPTLADILAELRRLRRDMQPPPAQRTLPMPRSDCNLTQAVLCYDLADDLAD